jgi:hypothetical protein
LLDGKVHGGYCLENQKEKHMGAAIGWFIIIAIFCGIFYAVAQVEGFWMTLLLFTGAILGTLLLETAFKLIQQ